MSNRRKIAVSPSSASLGPEPIALYVEPIELGMSASEKKVYAALGTSARSAMESAMDDLRLQGVSEQQLSAFLYAARLVCLEALWGADLEDAVFDFIQTGRGGGLREAVTSVLMPELFDEL